MGKKKKLYTIFKKILFFVPLPEQVYIRMYFLDGHRRYNIIIVAFSDPSI